MPPEQPYLPAIAGPNATATAERLAAWAEAAGGALSRNTVRALRSDLALYATWCRERDLEALPAEGATVAAYIDHASAGRAPGTVRRYVASIATAHGALGGRGLSRNPEVKLALQRMYRRNGRRQRQARGLVWPLRRRMLAAAGDRLIDARDRALLSVAYDALLRRSELVALLVEDLDVSVPGRATVLVRRGKTDPDGAGDALYLARDTVATVLEWLRRGDIHDGFLFRSVAKGGRVGESLDASQVPRIFKAMARRAGLPADVAASLSGHSARVGAAQDMIAAGIGLPAILQAGRWKTTAMVSRYGERLLLPGRSGAAQLARLQRRD